jgi:hypothetical protein
MLRNLLLGGTSPLALFAPETGGSEPAAEGTFTPTIPADSGPINAFDAAKAISEQRAKLAQPAETKPTEQPREKGRFTSAAAPQSALEGADAGPEEVPSETVEADPAEQPSIDPPRSWSKEDKELFASLPRETQERLSDRERSRESDFLKRQSEATEKSKALTAKEQAAEQARQHYETVTQNALQVLSAQTASEFADIKTDADVRNLAEQDPFRFVKWQAHQQQIGRLQNEVQANEQRRQNDHKAAFDTWSKEQDDAFTKQFPEFSDKEKGQKARDTVRSYLTEDIGIPEQGLAELWSNPLFRDAKTQRIMYDAARFRAAQQAAKSAVQAPKPQVVRPGTAAQKGSQFQDAIDAAQQRLKSSRGIEAARAAADLMRAVRAQATRR